MTVLPSCMSKSTGWHKSSNKMTSIKRNDMFGSLIVDNVETRSLKPNQSIICVLSNTYKVKFTIKSCLNLLALVLNMLKVKFVSNLWDQMAKSCEAYYKVFPSLWPRVSSGLPLSHWPDSRVPAFSLLGSPYQSLSSASTHHSSCSFHRSSLSFHFISFPFFVPLRPCPFFPLSLLDNSLSLSGFLPFGCFSPQTLSMCFIWSIIAFNYLAM